MIVRRLLFVFVILFSCSFPCHAEEFKPVVVYHLNIEKNPYNVAIHKGVEQFVAKTGKHCDEVIVSDKTNDYVAEIERLAQQGYSPIFLLYGAHYPKVVELARKFSTTRFIVFDWVWDEPNLYSFTLSTHEGAFLAGALAAMATKSGILGFVSVSDMPALRRFLCGYEQGARHIKPDIKVLSGFIGQYPGSWFDSEATASMANKLMDQGADVLFQVAGGAGPAVLEAAAKRGKLGIGVDLNQNGLFPGHVLTSMLKRTDMAVFAALMLAKRGIWRDNLKRLGLAQGAVDVVFDENNKSIVSKEMRERIERIKREIVLGSIVVHDYEMDLKCP
ncbi:BMP family ABC transporter substrate-binding protein [uncultured Pseudodesulfovibrio sp.]|uniref:BMP family ABC transporter substrate-binding protein n=1 Tax=uncultured Pseudodesulfovibrio sp. TaxID=2035858 RepID=UPI0029C6BC58|nr:BMP family ABC transporter substrate-binding protein [uncultured Pseudodesulfovibrio sp.]